jgi:hypothetical protein
MVLNKDEDISASGSNTDRVCIRRESFGSLSIHSCQDPSLFLSINSKTGQFQAIKIAGDDTDDIITIFQLIVDDEFSLSAQLVANVTLPSPCPDAEKAGSGVVASSGDREIVLTAEPKSCPVTVQCAIAFDAITKQAIDCHSQVDLAADDLSKSISILFAF